MKKSLLALAVASVAVSSVASAATVYDKDGTSVEMYGRVQSVLYSTHAAANDYADISTQTSGRLGFNLRTPLNESIAAYANAEWDVADNDKTRDDNGDDSFNVRRIYVGTDFGSYGKLQAGRFEDAIYWNVTSYSDVYEDWGCWGQFGDGDKRDGMLMYSWSGYGINFMATYGTAKDGQTVEGAWDADETLDLDNAYAVGLGYTTPDVLFGPISINVGYGSANVQSDAKAMSKNHNFDSYDNYAASLVWGSIDVGPYLAAVWNMRDFNMINSADDYTVQGVEAVVAYGFENGVSIRTGYQWVNNDEDNGKSVDGQIIPVYVNYNVTPNFNVWAEARFDVGTDDEFDAITEYGLSENVYSCGARYSF